MRFPIDPTLQQADPGQVLNPGKVFPVLRHCAEGGAVHVHAGEEKLPGLEGF